LDFIDAVEASIKSTVSPSPHSVTIAVDARNPDDEDSPQTVPTAHDRLTNKAEPPPTRGVNRDSGTASANARPPQWPCYGGWSG